MAGTTPSAGPSTSGRCSRPSSSRMSHRVAWGHPVRVVEGAFRTGYQMPLLTRLMVEDEAQDLIEYALLTAAIGLCALVGFSLWGGSISNTYKTLNTTTNKLWDPEPK